MDVDEERLSRVREVIIDIYALVIHGILTLDDASLEGSHDGIS